MFGKCSTICERKEGEQEEVAFEGDVQTYEDHFQRGGAKVPGEVQLSKIEGNNPPSTGEWEASVVVPGAAAADNWKVMMTTQEAMDKKTDGGPEDTTTKKADTPAEDTTTTTKQEEAAAVALKATTSSSAPPQAGAASFDVSVDWERLGVKTLGVDCSTIYEKCLVVERIHEKGAFWAWNMAHPEKWVGPGDRLLKVQDAEGDPQAMVRKAKDLVSQQVPLILQVEKKPREFTVKLSKTTPDDKRPLGVIVNSSPKLKDTLRVEEVKPRGMVGDWNKENQAYGWVAVGDTILAVNGLRGNPREMLEELKESATAGKDLELMVKSRTEYFMSS